jgi:hypothetical protein
MIMMKRRLLNICILAVLFGLMPVGALAKHHPNTIYLIKTFDFPGVGNSTTPFGINERGDIVGDYLDANNVRRGFVRFVSGNFQPIVAPNDTGNFTRARGINNARVITGDFFNTADNAFHGFIKNGGVFTQFDFGGPVSTFLGGNNDAGNFVGAFGGGTQPNQAFVRIGGTSTAINIPGAAASESSDINNFNRVVGDYSDGANFHGFLRHPNGSLTAPLDFPGSVQTVLNGINDQGWIVGNYTDAEGQQHGFFLKRPHTFVSFDFPNAAATSLNGINDWGFIVGRYTDAGGLRHGFVAWVWAF